ncbi:MAG: hypothetical protein GC193_06355 [Cryomorphaceae bacterium]|nr:hypothetical protein [Cryomorphaceae bacterium]
MKFFRNLAVLFTFSASLTASAAIINVNNATPSPGEFDNIDEAMAAAADGDSIYLAATNLSYGDVDITKQLFITGPGFIVNGGILGNFAEVGIVSFKNGPATTGSTLQSLKVKRVTFEDGSATNIIFSDITVQRCFIGEYLSTSNDILSNAVIQGCVFPGTSNFQTCNIQASSIENNFFRGLISSVSNSLISQNIFAGNGNETWLSAVSNSSITNNILIGRNANYAIGTNTINGNSSFGSANNNFQGTGVNLVNVDPQFVNFTAPEFAWDADLNLGAGSPCLNAGANGEDIGLYGGDGVYRQDCEPSIPIIRSVNIPGGNTVPANATFNINITSVAHE